MGKEALLYYPELTGRRAETEFLQGSGRAFLGGLLC